MTLFSLFNLLHLFNFSQKVKELITNETISEMIIAEKANSFVRKLIYQVSLLIIDLYTYFIQ